MPKIAAGATNKNISLAPNGTGKVVVGTGAADATVQSDGNHNLILQTGNSTTGKIEIADGANGNIDITPNGTGEVDIPKVDIDGGTVDGITLGTNSAVTEAQIDNINIDGNEITSTDTNGNIDLTPNGTGEVNISKVDIDGGAIDGTNVTVGSGKTLDVSAGSFTTSTAQKQAIIDGATIPASLPSQTGNADKLLTTNGSAASWTNAPINLVKLAFSGQSSAPGAPSAGTVYFDTTANVLRVYNGTEWRAIQSTVASVTANFLCIGGGGSGSFGGGGAGGYITSWHGAWDGSGSEKSGGDTTPVAPLTLTGGITYTITVGAGLVAGATETIGGSSSISGSDITDITALGGGQGGGPTANAGVGSTGGSGGGAGYDGDSGTGGGSGTSNQGTDGGNNGAGESGGGGGGGAGGAGGSGGGSTAGGSGGVGLASSITGVSVGRGGGGAGAYSQTGTSGGGDSASSTHGSNPWNVGGSGAQGNAYDNTGGGGGGVNGGENSSYGGTGGSGVVILRVPTASYSFHVTGNPTVTFIGSDTVMVFTGDGTYDA